MAAPELRLNVSLNLGFFRQQLRQLSTIASSEFNASLKVKFDRTALNKEIQALNRYVNNKTFNIKINTNLEAEIKAADRLVKALGRVQQAATGAQGGLPVGTGAFSRTKPKGGFSAAEIKTLFNAAIQGGLLDEKTLGRTRDQMVAGLGSIGKDAIAGLLNGLNNSNADIKRAGEAIGDTLIATTKKNLGIASPSKKFEEIGKNVGEGFEKGALSSMDNAFDALERKMRQRGKILDTVARGIFRMLGMDPAAMLQEAQQRRLPSAINWQATSPSRGGFISPSSTGRMLPPGTVHPGLPGTAMGSQKLLIGDILDPALKNAAREAANAFVDTIRKELNEAVRSVNVRDLGNALRPALSGSQVAGFLAPGVGRVSNPYATGRLGRDGETRAELFARREREARMRSALRGVDVMGEGGMAGRTASPYSYAYRGARPQGAIVPYAPGGAMVYSGPGGGGMPPGGGTGGGPGNFAGRGGGPGGGFNVPNLPGAGLVREIGQEFAFATKQVLLFGTAYKALAFATNFPAQVGQAVAALQSFNNTLKAVSPNAKEVEASNKLILQLVDKYNIPLQSARDGFTKLYASMQSAGFGGNEVRDIFTGISKAAATFGMSADKVDRVNYAFAQMASKGQVMSEELKGQLGDVLPGALGIFAEAAGFKGPDAIQKFSAALEDGAYKGQAMKQLLTNVGIVMNKEFGPGAEGAARTFQGAINRMQNSLTFLYEAFEPAAVQFLNAFVVPLTGGIKQLTDGFNAFFTGQAAQTAGGGAIAQQLNALKPSFEGILANIQALIPSFQLFGSLLLNVAKFLTTLAGNPIVGFLLKVYTNILLVNTAFTLLGGKILLGLIANINGVIARLIVFNGAMNSLAVASARAGAGVAMTQSQMLLLRSSAAGAVGPVNTLLGSLLRLAAIGTIAIVVTIAVNGLTQLADAQARIAKLRGEKDPVGPIGPKPVITAERRYVGATREKIQSDQRVQQELVAEYRNQLAALKATQTKGGAALGQTAVGGLSNILGGFVQENTAAKITELELKIKNAEEVLNLDPRQYRTEAERQRASVTATTSAVNGTSGANKPRESQIPSLKLELEYQRQLLALELEANRARLLDNNLAVIRLDGERAMLDLKREALQVDLEDLTPTEKKIKKEAIATKGLIAAEKTRNDMALELAKILEDHDTKLENIEKTSQQEITNRQAYLELLSNGIKPTHAKIVVEVGNEITALKEALSLRRLNLQEEIKLLKAKKASGGKIDEAALADLEKGLTNTENRIADLPAFGTAETARRLTMADSTKTPQEYISDSLEKAEDRMEELTNMGYQLTGAADAIGSAFGEAFKGIVSGSMTAQEALAGMFRGIADHFADMVGQIIAEWMRIELMQGLKSIFSAVLPAIGGGLGAGLSSGFSAGTASAIDTSAAGWGAAFNTNLKFANGGIAAGGFRAFANGGMVTGPTMGLVGEGRYNEAIIPLPDGKSVPVQLAGGAGGNAAPINTSIVVNVKNDQAESQMSGNQGNQLARELEGAVRQVILKESRPGGIIFGSR